MAQGSKTERTISKTSQIEGDSVVVTAAGNGPISKQGTLEVYLRGAVVRLDVRT
jgi:hypothetical protein